MKKAVIFDLDGTLLNTIEDIADSVNASLRHFYLPEVTLEKVRESVGNGGRTLMERVVQGGSAYERFEELLEYYVPYYQAHCRIKTAPYAGICEAMSELKAMNIKMAIVSNKGDGAVKELAAAYFGDLCETAVGERDGIRRKPAPDSVIEAMNLLGVTPEETLYAGDSEVDFETARNAGTDCVLVTWGFRPRTLLEGFGPKYLIDDPGQLAALIKEAE